MLVLPVILSLINVALAALFDVYLLINFARGLAYAVPACGFHVMRVHQKYPWVQMPLELEQEGRNRGQAPQCTWTS